MKSVSQTISLALPTCPIAIPLLELEDIGFQSLIVPHCCPARYRVSFLGVAVVSCVDDVSGCLLEVELCGLFDASDCLLDVCADDVCLAGSLSDLPQAVTEHTMVKDKNNANIFFDFILTPPCLLITFTAFLISDLVQMIRP
jgi:hypothetical protein